FVSPVVIAVIVALVVGKPLGIMITAWLSTHLAGLRMAKGLRVRDMFPAACACGIGFTVSFLIASLAYQDAELSAESRFGVLIASLIAAVISGILLSRQSKRFEAAQRQSSETDDRYADDGTDDEVETVLEDGTIAVSQMIGTRNETK
ncbi:Na+/H+ antiporter NhaA, partial [Bifidobacterium dentium]